MTLDSKPKLYRTFVAFPIEAKSVVDLQKLQMRLRPRLKSVRWTHPDDFHITVAFLGEIELDQVTRAAVAVKQLQQTLIPQQINVEGIEGFPIIQAAKIIYAKLGGSRMSEFIHQANEIRYLLDEQKIEYDHKPYIPHLTLGRAKIKQSLVKYQEYKISKSIRLGQVSLFISERTAGGSEYQLIR